MTTMPYSVGSGSSGLPGDVIGDVVFFDDFTMASLSNTQDIAIWDTYNSTGDVATISDAISDGVVSLVCGTDTGDQSTTELNGSPFVFEQGRDVYFECRLQVAALTAYPFVGMGAVGFSPALGAATAAHIGFVTQGNGNLDFSSADGTTQSVTDTGFDLTASEWVRVAFAWDGSSREFRAYVNGALSGKHTVADHNTPALDTNYTIILESTGNLSAETVSVDYVLATKKRGA